MLRLETRDDVVDVCHESYHLQDAGETGEEQEDVQQDLVLGRIGCYQAEEDEDREVEDEA